VTTDEIRLVIPAEEDFRPIAHLVTGGLAMRLDVTYDDLDDLQVGIEALLALRDDAGELVVSLLLMLAAIVVVIVVAARVYDRSVLRFGTPMKLREAVKIAVTRG